MTDSATDGKNKGGRPLKFKDVKALQKVIDTYFAECKLEEDTRVFKHGKTKLCLDPDTDNDVDVCTKCGELAKNKYGLPTQGCILVKGRLKYPHPPTITGLALALSCDKETIKNYEGRAEFSGPIKNAYLRVQQALEDRLFDSDTPAAKVIFGLANHDGWENKQRVDGNNNVKHSGKVSLGDLLTQADAE